MSVFKVQLQNTQQGLLDRDPSTASFILVGNPGIAIGSPFAVSKQRTIYVAGPHRTYRELHDGDVFTDCNYWKRFAFPQVPLDQAFIQVVTDDGTIYSDDSTENTYPLTYGGATPYTVAASDTFATNFIDILGTTGGYAVFAQLTNLGTALNQTIKVQLNGSTSAVMQLAAGDTQVFNHGDLAIGKLAFQGGGADTTIQVVLSVKTQCQS